MRILKNIRTAVENYRNWRAQKNMAERATKRRNRERLEKLSDRSRRNFLISSGRAAIIPAGLVLLGGGSSLVYHLLIKEKKTQKTRPEAKSDPKIKKMTLEILGKIPAGKTMSSRYFPFIEIIIRLVRENKIKIKLFTKAEDDPDKSCVYDSEINTLWISTAIKAAGPLRFKGMIIHELFHAYQDYIKSRTVRSVSEAEAYLAEYDYLLHNGYKFRPGWIKIDPSPKNKMAYFVSFNVPKSIIMSSKNSKFSSPEYAKSINLIADNYFWMSTFWITCEAYAYLSLQVVRPGWNMRKIKSVRQRYLRGMQNHPGKVLENDQQHTVANFLATTKYVVDDLWQQEKKDEAAKFLNQSLIDFKRALRPVKSKMFEEDIPISDGIH